MASKTQSRSTARGSSKSVRPSPEKTNHANDAVHAQLAATEEVAAAVPYNVNKSAEYGSDAGAPPAGDTVESVPASVSGSTLSEGNGNDKTGAPPQPGAGPLSTALERVRVNSAGQRLTTNQGVPVGDNQSSLKAGLRGPTLLEDFILREKITHFDHERIPERIVHARGSAAHGYFENYKPQAKLTRASIFAEAGKRTPVFVRFSTVAGERGSADTARDVRGFAVKFYTDEGNWDLVGNNIPIFFIQDAMKFPDLVHAVKPEPHNAMPQAASAHDTFWDFISLMPESTAMMMWVMSDRAIPRSYRMMQGFGVHTYRLVNARGESQFVKFHWNPTAGTHSLVWDEALRISGADPDFHRRDLWDAIEAGAYPEWELGVQIFSEEQAEKFSFDVLDPTKIVPEELVPVIPVGRLVLNRNPDNFFAETEQVAFCVAHVVPGVDFSNDPLLAGRIHSYIDTQISRLGGPNFHEIPINGPLAPVHNNQRDGMHRQAVPRGRVSYEPNSLGGGCPFQAGAKGFVSFAQPNERNEPKLRGKPEKFADHYTQATLFWESQSQVEKQHIIKAFRFELTKVQVPAIRERMVSSLVNVAPDLAQAVAQGLGITVPKPMPKAVDKVARPEVKKSPALSLFARPGEGGIRTRKVAIIAVDGVHGGSLRAVQKALKDQGAVPLLLGVTLEPVPTSDGRTLSVDATLETAAPSTFDAVVLPGGSPGRLTSEGHVMDFVKEHYRHCKAILALGDSAAALDKADIPARSAKPANGIVRASEEDVAAGISAFIEAVARHRHYERETDPPRV